MIKEIKDKNNYIFCNIDEPYAHNVLKAIIDGENKKEFGSWTESEDFDQWCIDTFGGKYVMYLTIDGMQSYWLPLKAGLNDKTVVKEVLYNILYENLAGGEIETLKLDHNIDYNHLVSDFGMCMQMINISRCKDKVINRSANIMLLWEWVTKEDLEREWSGF